MGRVLVAPRRLHPPEGARFVALSRRAGADLAWQPGEAPPPDLPRAEAVLALWGVTAGSPDDLAMNAALARHARDLARASGAARIIHLSSAAVYGPGTDLSETMPPMPRSDYGRAKQDMEQAVARMAAEDGLHHCCIRLGNLLGACSLSPALRKGHVTLDCFANGHGPQRSYIAPGTLAGVLTALLELPSAHLPLVLNLASAPPVFMEDLARAAGARITWRPAPGTAVPAVTLDTTRLTRLLPGLPLTADAAALVADWRKSEGPA